MHGFNHGKRVYGKLRGTVDKDIHINVGIIIMCSSAGDSRSTPCMFCWWSIVPLIAIILWRMSHQRKQRIESRKEHRSHHKKQLDEQIKRYLVIIRMCKQWYHAGHGSPSDGMVIAMSAHKKACVNGVGQWATTTKFVKHWVYEMHGRVHIKIIHRLYGLYENVWFAITKVFLGTESAKAFVILYTC